MRRRPGKKGALQSPISQEGTFDNQLSTSIANEKSKRSHGLTARLKHFGSQHWLISDSPSLKKVSKKSVSWEEVWLLNIFPHKIFWREISWNFFKLINKKVLVHFLWMRKINTFWLIKLKIRSEHLKAKTGFWVSQNNNIIIFLP